jgi:MFS family permease
MQNILGWLIATIFFTYQYILRVMPNIMIDDIMYRFEISAATVGQVAGLYYVSYTLMHIPVAILLDRIGPKKIIPIAALCTVIGSLPLVYSNSWILLISGRILVGMASSVGVLGVFKVIRMNFAEEKFTFMFGLSVFIALIGAMYGGQPLNYLINKFGWSNTLNISCCIGIIIAVFAYFIIHEKKSDIIHSSIIGDLKKLFSLKKWLIISIIGGFMIGPVEGFADNWGTKFFSVVYPGMNNNTSAFLPSVILLGLAIGSPLIGFISSRLGRYYTILTLCSITMLCGFYAILYYNLSVSLLFIILLAVGIASSYQTLIIYLASTFVPKNITSLATACSNMIMMIFGFFFHSIIGHLAHEGINQKTVIINSLSIIPYTLAISIIALMLFKKFTK